MIDAGCLGQLGASVLAAQDITGLRFRYRLSLGRRAPFPYGNYQGLKLNSALQDWQCPALLRPECRSFVQVLEK